MGARLKKFFRNYYNYFLGMILGAVWLWSAIDPKLIDVWVVENIMAMLGIFFIFLVSRYFKASKLTYTFITIFFVMHFYGAHYSYSHTPFGFFLEEVFNSNRNMYDRLIHFSFGLLMAYPLREVFFKVARSRGIWTYVYPFTTIVLLSSVFEVIEWKAVALSQFLGFEVGQDFLGMQGDIFDAQKDMLVAWIGAFIALGVNMLMNWIYSPTFAKEMKASFKIGEPHLPAGEVKFKDVMKDKKDKIREKTREIRDKRRKRR